MDLIVLNAGASLNPIDPTHGVLMGVPDDFTWAVKFGAMADLLGADGPAKDSQRAAYCQRRWEEGIALAKIAESVLFLTIDGVPMYSEALATVDTARHLWENYSGNPPFMGAMTGLNLMAMIDPPGGSYSITLDLVTNALIPSSEGDYIQLGREELAAVLGYAEHLATFKCGGAEFAQTMRHYDRIMSLATSYNLKLAAITQPALQDRSLLEEAKRPTMLRPTPV